MLIPLPQDRYERVFGLAGLIASGKSTVAALLNEEHSYHLSSFGEMVRRSLAATSRNPDRESLHAASARLVAQLGYDELTDRLVASMDKHPRQAIDGIRHVRVASRLAMLFGASFRLLYIEAPEEIRYARFLKRKRFNSDRTLKSFRIQEADPVESGTTALRPIAHLVISNDDDVTRLRSILAQLVNGDPSSS